MQATFIAAIHLSDPKDVYINASKFSEIFGDGVFQPKPTSDNPKENSKQEPIVSGYAVLSFTLNDIAKTDYVIVHPNANIVDNDAFVGKELAKFHSITDGMVILLIFIKYDDVQRIDRVTLYDKIRIIKYFGIAPDIKNDCLIKFTNDNGYVNSHLNKTTVETIVNSSKVTNGDDIFSDDTFYVFDTLDYTNPNKHTLVMKPSTDFFEASADDCDSGSYTIDQELFSNLFGNVEFGYCYLHLWLDNPLIVKVIPRKNDIYRKKSIYIKPINVNKYPIAKSLKISCYDINNKYTSPIPIFRIDPTIRTHHCERGMYSIDKMRDDLIGYGFFCPSMFHAKQIDIKIVTDDIIESIISISKEGHNFEMIGSNKIVNGSEIYRFDADTRLEIKYVPVCNRFIFDNNPELDIKYEPICNKFIFDTALKIEYQPINNKKIVSDRFFRYRQESNKYQIDKKLNDYLFTKTAYGDGVYHGSNAALMYPKRDEVIKALSMELIDGALFDSANVLSEHLYKDHLSDFEFVNDADINALLQVDKFTSFAKSNIMFHILIGNVKEFKRFDDLRKLLDEYKNLFVIGLTDDFNRDAIVTYGNIKFVNIDLTFPPAKRQKCIESFVKENTAVKWEFDVSSLAEREFASHVDVSDFMKQAMFTAIRKSCNNDVIVKIE